MEDSDKDAKNQIKQAADAEQSASEVRILALALTFPSVDNAPENRRWTWDAATLDRWASATPRTLVERVTARFLLAVWDPNHAWACGPFDVMEALRVWDERHRAAFLAWAALPWWSKPHDRNQRGK